MKKLKYALPLIIVTAFPVYWEFMAKQMAFITTDPSNQAFCAAMIIVFVGFAACAFTDLIL